MKKIFLLPLLLSSLLKAQEPDSASAIFGLREAERSFAKTSVMLGRQAAFSQFLNDESYIFTDKWISNGKELWKNRKPSPSVLKWEPEFMIISGSGDFGVSTGPWEAQEYRPYTKALGTGYFLSVWKKQPDGTWRVLLDNGISTPAKTSDFHSFRYLPWIKMVKSQKSDLQMLEDLDIQLFAKVRELPGESDYLNYHDNHSLVLFNGHMPSENRDSIRKWISSLKRNAEWKHFAKEVSSSGDLGFTCGYISATGNYVRIWRKNDRNEWKIVIEALNP
jgi:ketosteroid isomerase-like protein